MNIAILGDSHDHYENLKTAVQIANEQGCKLMLHTGDLGAPGSCTEILKDFTGHVKMICGNNDHEQVGLMKRSAELDNFELTKSKRGGDMYEDTVDSVRIFMHHYPRIAELVAASGEFDLCICGHSHQYREERIGETLLLNPSSLNPYETTASMVIFDTSNRSHERIIL